jgi:hypothetical protein
MGSNILETVLGIQILIRKSMTLRGYPYPQMVAAKMLSFIS